MPRGQNKGKDQDNSQWNPQRKGSGRGRRADGIGRCQGGSGRGQGGRGRCQGGNGKGLENSAG